MVSLEDSRLKMVGLDVLPTYKRVMAWFPGPVKDTEGYFLRLCGLNQVMDTGTGEFMSLRRNPMGPALCSESIQFMPPHWREWDGHPSGERDKLSSPFWVSNRKGRNRKRKRRKRRRPNVRW
jgi:hypothetical protein